MTCIGPSWVTLIVGVLAVVGVALTVRQRTVADKRAQAWQRITWCLDHTVSDNGDEADKNFSRHAMLTVRGLEREVKEHFSKKKLF